MPGLPHSNVPSSTGRDRRPWPTLGRRRHGRRRDRVSPWRSLKSSLPTWTKFHRKKIPTDGHPCHHLEESLDMCHDVGILPICLAAHSSCLTQALHVGLFVIHESARWRIRAQTAQFTKILGVWQAVATLPNVITAPKQTGLHLIWDRDQRALVTSVDPATVRKPKCERTVDKGQGQ
jgi:hypothetical protein